MSSAASFVLRSVRRVKDHHHLPHHSQRLKNTCVRQVELDKWFPLSYAYIYIYIYIYICMHIYIYMIHIMYTYIYIYIYIYIYVHMDGISSCHYSRSEWKHTFHVWEEGTWRLLYSLGIVVTICMYMYVYIYIYIYIWNHILLYYVIRFTW